MRRRLEWSHDLPDLRGRLRGAAAADDEVTRLPLECPLTQLRKDGERITNNIPVNMVKQQWTA